MSTGQIALSEDNARGAAEFAEKHGMSVNEVVNTAVDDWLSDRANIEAYAPFTKSPGKAKWENAKPR